MLGAAETGNSVSKKAFKQLVPELRISLVNDQYDPRGRPFSVLILLTGGDSPSISEAAARLHEWMDARYIDIDVFLEPRSPQRDPSGVNDFFGHHP
jgi:hypothetical protein